MNIVATTNFKHAKFAFTKGEAYTVPDALGGYFMGVGWARAQAEGDPVAKSVPGDALAVDAPQRTGNTLDIQSARVGVTTK
jgi:hypothetical protein